MQVALGEIMKHTGMFKRKNLLTLVRPQYVAYCGPEGAPTTRKSSKSPTGRGTNAIFRDEEPAPCVFAGKLDLCVFLGLLMVLAFGRAGSKDRHCFTYIVNTKRKENLTTTISVTE
jgi:hypothetical protein